MSDLTSNRVGVPGAMPLKRRALIVGIGAAAAALGVGAAWWQFGYGGKVSRADATQTLWALQCETPDGVPLAMESLRGKRILVNFWATWCPPCIEELPMVDAFFKEHAAKGWQVVGLAIDQPSAVRAFLQKTPVSFPIGMVGMAGTELVQSLGNMAGGLPFSVVIGRDGTIYHRKMGKIEPADLRHWASLQ